MGRRTGEFVSPRSRPKVLSPDNLAIFVAQLVGENILHTWLGSGNLGVKNSRRVPGDLKKLQIWVGWDNQINLRSFSSAPNFGVVAATDFNGMAIFSCPFLLEVRCRTPLPIIVTSQSFAKPNPTVQRMTSNYKNWLAWGF